VLGASRSPERAEFVGRACGERAGRRPSSARRPCSRTILFLGRDAPDPRPQGGGHAGPLPPRSGIPAREPLGMFRSRQRAVADLRDTGS
jgi:hypothetical protein